MGRRKRSLIGRQPGGRRPSVDEKPAASEEPAAEAEPAADPFAKSASVANPGAKNAGLPKSFAEEEDDDWFLRTGQPAPQRFVGGTEPPANRADPGPRASGSPNQMAMLIPALVGIGVLASLGFVVLIIGMLL